MKDSIKKLRSPLNCIPAESVDPSYWYESFDISSIVNGVIETVAARRKREILIWDITTIYSLTTDMRGEDNVADNVGVSKEVKLKRDLQAELKTGIEIFRPNGQNKDKYFRNLMDLYKIIAKAKNTPSKVTPSIPSLPTASSDEAPLIYFPLNLASVEAYEKANNNLGESRGIHWIFVRYDILNDKFIVCDSIRDGVANDHVANPASPEISAKLDNFFKGLMEKLKELEPKVKKFEEDLAKIENRAPDPDKYKDVFQYKLKNIDAPICQEHSYRIRQTDGSFCGPSSLLNMILDFEGINLPCDVRINQDDARLLRSILYKLSTYSYLGDKSDKTEEEQVEECYQGALSEIMTCIANIIERDAPKATVTKPIIPLSSNAAVNITAYEASHGKKTIAQIRQECTEIEKIKDSIDLYKYEEKSGYLSRIDQKKYNPLIGQEIYEKVVKKICRDIKDIKVESRDKVTKLGYELIGFLRKSDLSSLNKESLEKILKDSRFTDSAHSKEFDDKFVKLFTEGIKKINDGDKSNIKKTLNDKILRYRSVDSENNLLRLFLAISVSFLVLSTVVVGLDYLKVWNKLGLNNAFLNKVKDIYNAKHIGEVCLLFSGAATAISKPLLNSSKTSLSNAEKELMDDMLKLCTEQSNGKTN